MKRIGVIHREGEPQEGGDILSYIQQNLSDKYEPVEILIYQDGSWNINGLLVLPSELVHRIDMAWNLSGSEISQILNNFSIPNISVPAFSTSLKESKEMLREHIQNTGLNMPMHFVLPAYQEDFDKSIEEYAMLSAKKVFQKFGSPWIVKSLTPDISMGVHIANTYPELVNAIIDGAEHGGSILVEELMAGKEGTMHSLSSYRGEDVYTMPVSPMSNFSKEEKEKLMVLSKNLHTHLGNHHYLKSNFLLTPHRGIYITNIDFNPDFRADSDFCKSSESIGARRDDIFEHILSQAL